MFGLGGLFSGKKKTSTVQTSHREATQEQESTTKSGTKSQQQQTGRTTALDEETLGAITSVVRSLAGDVTGNLNVQDIIAAQQKEAIRQFEESDLAAINRLSQQVGSIDNSFVQELRSKGMQDLQTRLAALGMDTAMKARFGAADALSRAGVVAKGSDVASTTNLTGESASEINTDAFVKLVEDLTSTATTKQSNKPSLFDVVTSLL